MRIDKIIKKQRNSLGLTQEQVALYLGVSTPAVNKWEKGVSYPDITILPPLARLLKVDLNTLLSFHDELSQQEITVFLNEIVQTMQTQDFDSGYAMAMEKIHQYPTCERLILNIALILQGGLSMFRVVNRDDYTQEIIDLFERSAKSHDLEIRNQGVSMLVSTYLKNKDYDKAQKSIDSLPTVTYDKEQLQGSLYIQSGELEKASELFENKLISASSEINGALLSMIEIALKENRNEDATYFAEIIEKTTKLYDLWEYIPYAAYFQLYFSGKNDEKCISTLEKMLPIMSRKWDVSKSRLYQHIKQKITPKENEARGQQQFLQAFSEMLKNDVDGEFEFLKECYVRV